MASIRLIVNAGAGHEDKHTPGPGEEREEEFNEIAREKNSGRRRRRRVSDRVEGQ